MAVKLAVEIVHVPGDALRRQWLEIILARTAAFEPHVVEDTTRAGCWPTMRRAYERVAQRDCTHALVLADDMVPCVQFAEAVTGAIEAQPHEPVSLFTMHQVPVATLLARGEHWFTCPSGVFSATCVIPIADARGFVTWADTHVDLAVRGEDQRLQLYFIHERRRPFWVTVPSLVQHVGASNSLMGNNNRQRIARSFLGDGQAAAIDWTPPDRPLRVGGKLMPSTVAGYRP